MTSIPVPDATGPAERPDLSGLLELARDRRLDLKPVILRVQTDLFAAAPARDRGTVAAYEALALGLLPTVDDASAASVARVLAPVPEAPDAVLAALAARGGPARDAVVRGAPELSATVLAAAGRDGADLAPLVAARAGLGGGRVRELAGRADPAIDRALAENRGVALGGAALAGLVARARDDAALAALLFARTDLSGSDLAPLYRHADAEVRARIRATVAELAVLRHAPTPDIAEGDPGPVLTALAARQDLPGFSAVLAEALRLPELALAPADPADRDTLALALRAAGVPEEDAVFVFLTLDPTLGRSVEAVFGLVALFRETRRAAALDLLAAIVGREAPGTARAEPAPPAAARARTAERAQAERGGSERQRPVQATQPERRRRVP